MIIRYLLKQMKRFVRFAFYPIGGILFFSFLILIIIVFLAFLMHGTPRNTVLYDIVFAFTTGAAGSFFVFIIVELSHNYYHNYLSWHELKDLNLAVWQYETKKEDNNVAVTESNVQVNNNTTGEAENVDIVNVTW